MTKFHEDGNLPAAALNSALAVSMSFDEPMGSPPVRWMVTLHSQTGGMCSSARRDTADALPAFEQAIVSNTDCSELQHILVYADVRNVLSGADVAGAVVFVVFQFAGSVDVGD